VRSGRLCVRRAAELPLDPARDHVHDIVVLLAAERAPLRDAVPAVQAGPAAGRGRVLGDEDRMAAVRRLLAVLGRLGGGEPLRDQLVRMPAQALRPVQLREPPVSAAEAELRAEVVPADPVDAAVDRVAQTGSTTTTGISRSVRVAYVS